ncbi:IclR family transcriptional regulator [Saccharopolyspora erythraea NRRL 2338]|uniref:IclR family transcriptional regulator n=1 Tax=Saccharopolyspora erythraea TaxID=1836 RepID=A0ABN1C4T7_SACER|nr:IclR family transcriptional regulator [Saccharopolyspora erythraea]EQD84285.1 IclR family transcriptional regulator [Saccharopolyspora erythraea D]PFG97312.1 IclR family transcriptional regulator [Saccharopolyspora erythraea NRRL 2338]QRK87500.1 IclR family transcriptional regulator [Saccharopolyspora erythraea]
MAARDEPAPHATETGTGTKQAPLLVLGKIAEILNAFTLARSSMTLREIQQRTGLPASTVQRLVTNMVAHGFLDRAGDKIRIGVRMAYWAGAAAKDLDVLEVVNPVLKDLRDQTGETACFFRAEGTQRVCVAVAETHHALRREMSVGKIAPIPVGSSGRVLLAWNPELAERVLQEELPQLTDSTITDRDELRRLLKQTRAEGYAITVGERIDGASGLAAPVFDSAGDLVGALMIQGPTLRMPAEKCVEWVDTLVEHAEQITRAIGGRYPS